MSSGTYAKKKYTLSTTWTDVIAPFNCDYVAFRNTGGQDILFRTDSTDASTEEVLVPNAQDGVTSLYAANRTGSNPRFMTGAVVISAKSSDANPAELRVTWVK